VYAVLSLTVIRMVPVAIALMGTQLRPATVAFMGWFGPRGLASVVFTLLALEEIEHGGGAAMLLQTVTWTILLSVVLHGLSASPLAARYGASIAKAGQIPEKAPAGEPRIRLHDLAGRHRHGGQQQARVTTEHH
jgi:NhaP-type Na+/H+ or K+/H+ antiporter